MDSNEKVKRKINPRENANIFSKLTFFFALSTFRLGLRKEIDENDIYEVVRNCQASKLGNVLEKEWEKEKLKSNPHIFIPLMRLFGPQYITYGLLLLLINTTLIISKPLLIGKIVAYFAPAQTEISQENVTWYSLALIGCFLLNTFFIHTYFFAVEQLGLRIKTAICSLLYRKSLTLGSNFVGNSSQGLVVTLMTKDVATVDLAMFFINHLMIGVVQLILMTFVMYSKIGASAVAGTSVLLVCIPLQGFLAKKTFDYKLKTVKNTDERLQFTQELLTAIRIIKMYTWELFFSKSISEIRRKEIKNLRSLFYIKSLGISIGQLSTKIAMYVCVVTYIGLGNHITAEKAFVVKGCFDVLLMVVMFLIPVGMFLAAEFKACLGRITNFLLTKEVTKHYAIHDAEEKTHITVKNVTVNYPQKSNILNDVNINIKSGLTILTGSVGSGKSTLLKLILGDVGRSYGDVEVYGKMSYSSQEPWIFPGTIKQNIVFNERFDQNRYQNVLKVCALNQDLNSFTSRDYTYVTDKGLNLSRGQKTRITLARAVYKIADIYLFDDCLSAVDMHVGKQIFFECIKNFLGDKIRILVTHQIWCLPKCDNIVVLSEGSVKYQGSYESLKDLYDDNVESELNGMVGNVDSTLSKIENESDDYESLDDENTKLLFNEKLFPEKNIYEEFKEEGSVKKEVYFAYFAFGGIKLMIFVLFLSILAQCAIGGTEFFITTWVDSEQALASHKLNETTNTTEYKILEASSASMIKQYSFIIFAACVLSLLKSVFYFIFCTRISTNIHASMLEKITKAGMLFFDNNLSGNILNRFSRDLGLIDDIMPFVIYELSIALFVLLTIVILVSIVSPIFLIPSAIFAIILFFARRAYLPTGRSLRRLQGTTRSAVIGYLNSTMEGLTTIRASEAQKNLIAEFDKHQDLYNSVTFMCISTTRAFTFYLDSLSIIYIIIIIITLVFFITDLLAGKVGLALTQSLALTGVLQWAVRQLTELENQMTASERLIEYTKIEPERKIGNQPLDWPLHGKIVYDQVNLRYSPNKERILKDISFTILPEQKIGVVGRTGAGKSSIISVLFRLYRFNGTIKIDEVDINTTNVDVLRSKISVIPQDPVLFSGTIRSNLDPYQEYADKNIWKALEEVEMKSLVGNLNMSVTESGSNFSIGQRQLICLARAILRNNKILILDEATANIDPTTDDLIQRTIKKLFANCTIITVAHRIHTIMNSDRVIVMEDGHIVEFDHPKILTKNKSGMFYKMVKESSLI